MTWGNNSTFQILIIQGTQAITGLFLYNGLGSPTNPPQFAAVASGVTTDPFGNAITSSKILIQGNVITESGGIFRTAATSPLIQLDGPHNAILVYDAAGVLRETMAPVATNDGLGSTVQPGITAYQNNSVWIQLVGGPAGPFLQAQSGSTSVAPFQVRTSALPPGSVATISTEQYPADGGANQLNLRSPAASPSPGVMSWTGISFQVATVIALVGGVAETWHAASLAAGFAAGAVSPRFQFEPVNGGRVRLSGQVSLTANQVAGTTMFTLPAGYVPSRVFHFVTQSNLSGGSVNGATVQVTAAGAVQIAPAGSNGNFVGLDGLVFELD